MTPPEDENPDDETLQLPTSLTDAQLRERAEHTADPHVRAAYGRALRAREQVAAEAKLQTDHDAPYRAKVAHDAKVQARVAAMVEDTERKAEEEEHARAVAAREADETWLASLSDIERAAVKQHRIAQARAELEANDPVARTRAAQARLVASVRI